ncbi:MAG TPA: GNAT family N-acetyltransferase [Polyangiaceae bacterium]
MLPRVRLATLDEAPLVHATMIASFEEYRTLLVVPSSAHTETIDDVRSSMEKGGAVIASFSSDESPAGCARFRVDPDALYVGRVAVLPAHRRRGVASAMMRFLEGHAGERKRDTIRIIARESLPGNVELYRGLGYEIVKVAPHPRGPDREVWMQKRLA